MTNIRNDVLQWFLFALFVIILKESGAEKIFDFEQVKNELFTRSQMKDFNSGSTRPDDKQCLKEIEKIGMGLQNLDNWAIRMVDAWGKIPSGILEGNFYDFGAFSECFNIRRDNDLYGSKYCTGKLKFEVLGKEVSHSVNEPLFTPRMIIPQPEIGKTMVFGLCVPSVCSLDYLQDIMTSNYTINHPIKITISINLLENTCQLEESATELRTLDWVTIVLLATVSIFVVLSTSYDVLYTVHNREKSQALLAFSFYTNGMKLLSYKRTNSTDMMHCLHGIRALSTMWIVMGHSFAIFTMFPIRNYAEFPIFLSKYENMFLLSAPIAVDTFFFLSGLLVSINLLKHFKKTNGKVNIFVLYLHRYLRLTPLFGISFLFSMTLLRFCGNGPVWPSTMDFLSQQCERHWWSALLYVQNYVNPGDICFGHSWYLSVDMQLFIISPLIVYLIYRYNLKALLGMVLLVAGCVACTVAVHVKNELKGVFDPVKMEKAYNVTHIRFSPWLVGVLAGYFLFRTRNKPIRIPKIFNLCAWMLCVGLMAAVIFANYPLLQVNNNSTPFYFGLYDGLSRVFWSIALGYIIFACVHNLGGPVNLFLSHPLWQPISRVCYSIYLLHFPVFSLPFWQ